MWRHEPEWDAIIKGVYTLVIHVDHSSKNMPSLRHFCLQYLRAGISACLPSSCALCRQTGDALLCVDCRQQYFKKELSRCRQCAIPLAKHDAHFICGECLSSPPGFDGTVVASDYSAPADQLVLALKFGHRLALSALFAELLRDAALRATEQHLPEILCAVPLGQQRLRERGFNQSLEIAKLLALQLGIRLDPELMRRTRETAQQSGLHPDERQKNVRNAFTPNQHAIELIKGKHIGVVDDVMTTGTTLHEIATVLKRFGASKVTNYVFARTPHH